MGFRAVEHSPARARCVEHAHVQGVPLHPPWDQETNLRRWAELHCAQSIVFRDGRGVVFVGLKDELRTSASFARAVRRALRRLCVDVPLRGRWCVLITPREALCICASDCAARDAALPPEGGAVDVGNGDSDVRVVTGTRDGTVLTPLGTLLTPQGCPQERGAWF